MPARGRCLLERTDRLVEPGEDVRRPVRVDPADEALQIRRLAQWLGLDDPVGGTIERHDTELVPCRERRRGAQDGLLADVDLPHALELSAPTVAAIERVAVAGVHRAGLVDDDDEGHVRLLLAIADAHVNRQRLLELRLRVPARAEAIRPADHHKAAPEVANVDLERRELAIAHPDTRDIHEHDAVVARERREVRRECFWNDRIDVLLLGLERGHELGGDIGVPGKDEDPRLALDDRVRVGPVVLAERVPRGLDDHPERVEAGLGRLDLEDQPVGARLEVGPLGGDKLAVCIEPDDGGLVHARDDRPDHFDGLAQPRR